MQTEVDGTKVRQIDINPDRDKGREREIDR